MLLRYRLRTLLIVLALVPPLVWFFAWPLSVRTNEPPALEARGDRRCRRPTELIGRSDHRGRPCVTISQMFADSRGRVVSLSILALLVVGRWASVAAIMAANWGGPNRTPLAVALGTVYGQASLAAVWLTLGPGRIGWRWLGSPAWLGAIVVAWVSGMLVSSAWSSTANMESWLIAGSVGGQWLLAQPLLWLLAWWRGVQIVSGPADLRTQFAIRELLMLTAGVAGLLGAGRALLPWLAAATQPGNEAPVFAFVVAANVVLTLPICLGALLPRAAWLGTAVALAFAAGATLLELNLLRTFFGSQDRQIGPEVNWTFYVMNGVQAAWALAAMGLLRLAGFRLGQRAPRGGNIGNFSGAAG